MIFDFYRLGESCSHVGAILFKIEAAVRLGYTKQAACTDVACKWNDDFVKNITGKKISEIMFYKKAKISTPVRRTFSEATKLEQNQFLKGLNELPNSKKPIALSLFGHESSSFHEKKLITPRVAIPKSLREYYRSTFTETEIEEEIAHLKGIKYTNDQINLIENSSKLQSLSLTWKEQRIGRITASIAHDVLHTNQEEPAKSIIKKICIPSKSISHLPSLSWGINNEKNALSDYETIQSVSHDKFSVKTPGLRLDINNPCIGASADGISTCKCHGTTTVEIKCPFKHKDSKNIDECIKNDKTFCLDDNLQLKRNHKYWAQVQLQMYIYNTENAHFVVWTPQFCHISHIKYDPEFEKMVKKLITFHQRHVCRELVTRAIENSDINIKEKQHTELYCYCQQTFNEKKPMVGCDGENCNFKWIHYKCASIKRPPKGAWYCKECKKNNKKKLAKK